jgi:hypothetical protein
MFLILFSILHAPCSMLHARAPCSMSPASLLTCHSLFFAFTTFTTFTTSTFTSPPIRRPFTFHSLSAFAQPQSTSPPVPCEPRHSPLAYQILLCRIVARRIVLFYLLLFALVVPYLPHLFLSYSIKKGPADYRLPRTCSKSAVCNFREIL